MITNRLILIACLTLGFISSYNLLDLSYAKYFICRKCNFVISDGLDLNLGYPSGLAGRARRWPKFGFLLALMIENIFTDPVNLISIWLLSHSKWECNFSEGTPWSVPDLKGPLGTWCLAVMKPRIVGSHLLFVFQKFGFPRTVGWPQCTNRQISSSCEWCAILLWMFLLMPSLHNKWREKYFP